MVNDIFCDFQSLIFRVTKLTWEEFKDYILNDKSDNTNMLRSTMDGKIKPTNVKIEKVLINDDIHLEIITIHGKYNFKTNVKYYMVTDEAFSNLR
jgi:hypothetical protein